MNSRTETPHVDGAVVTIGDVRILVEDENGNPASLEGMSEVEGYALYTVDSDEIALQFMQVSSDE